MQPRTCGCESIHYTLYAHVGNRRDVWRLFVININLQHISHTKFAHCHQGSVVAFDECSALLAAFPFIQLTTLNTLTLCSVGKPNTTHIS